MELNSKNYVNLELAIKLKEIGYNIPCNSYYRKDYPETSKLYENYNNSEIFKGYYSCPLLYDVQSWFREVHNIQVYPVICDSIKCYNIDENGVKSSSSPIPISGLYKCSIYWNGNNKTNDSIGTYERSLLDGLLMATDILNKQIKKTKYEKSR